MFSGILLDDVMLGRLLGHLHGHDVEVEGDDDLRVVGGRKSGAQDRQVGQVELADL